MVWSPATSSTPRSCEQERLGRSLGRVLVDQGVLTESQLVASLAAQIGMRFVDLGDIQVDGSALARVPGHVARRHTAIPIGFEDGKLVVAMADPANVFAIDDIKSVAGGGGHIDVKPVVATRNDVVAAIDRYYRAGEELDDLTTEIDMGEEEEDLSKVKEITEDAPIVRYVNLLITQAIQDRASDIHLEPTEHDLRVRYRIDGVLHEVMRSPRAIQSGVISRLKIMADINIAERRIPQDGRLSVNGARQEDRPARRDPPHGVGREGRHANPGQLDGPDGPRPTSGSAPTTSASSRSPTSSPTA